MSVRRDRIEAMVRLASKLYEGIREVDDIIKSAILSDLKNYLEDVTLREFLYTFKEPKVESREELERLIKESLGVSESVNLYDILKRVTSRSNSSRDE